MPQSATFYTMLNTGFAVVPPSKDATFFAAENTGIMQDSTPKSATFTSLENIGFPLPPQVDLKTPQVGWGMALIPKRQVSLLIDGANAVFYNFEGDVTT